MNIQSIDVADNISLRENDGNSSASRIFLKTQKDIIASPGMDYMQPLVERIKASLD